MFTKGNELKFDAPVTQNYKTMVLINENKVGFLFTNIEGGLLAESSTTDALTGQARCAGL